jgi:hypothetical protein
VERTRSTSGGGTFDVLLRIKLHFHGVGLAAQNGEITFHVPAVKEWNSFSVKPEPHANQQGTVKCSVRTLRSIMNEFGHTHIDLVKIDIEGFEYEVIKNIIVTGVRPRFLLVEFHHRHNGFDNAATMSAVESLRNYGYKIYWVSDIGTEYGFIDCVPDGVGPAEVTPREPFAPE